MKPLKIFVSALEYSANLHLLNLLEAFQKYEIDFKVYGIFDDKLICKENCISLYSPAIFRIMGFSGILKLIPTFFNTKKHLAKLANTCDIALFMDSSSFNIPLIQTIRKSPHKPYIVYYILPQVWAWKAYRAKTLAKICDTLWGILPFEKDFYPPNAPISYVGHPLLDGIPYSYTTQQNTNKIAFMPGSRKGEIQSLFPIFRNLAKQLKAYNKQAILIVPKTFNAQHLNLIYGDTSDFEIAFDTYSALKECEFAFVCSGTATLESTLLGIPTILAYKTKTFDFWIAKALVKLNFIGLANIFLEFLTFGNPKNNPNPKTPLIHPEFLQNSVTLTHLKNAYLNYDYAYFFAQKTKLMEYLKQGSAQTCAQNLENLAKNL